MEKEKDGGRPYSPLTLERYGHIDEIDSSDITLTEIHIQLLVVAAQATQIEAAKLFAHLPWLIQIQREILTE